MLVTDLLKLMWRGLLAPVVVAIDRGDKCLSYKEALTYYVTRLLLGLPQSTINRILGWQATLLHRLYPANEVVNTPQVRGLWFGQTAAEAKASGLRGHVTILYMHGGGFVMGEAISQVVDVIQPVLDALVAQELGARVFSLQYDLAPVHRFPHQPQQAWAVGSLHAMFPHGAYEWLLAQGATSVVLLGNSAGGTLAVSVMQEAAKRGAPQPLGAILLSPWVDLTHTSPSMTRHADSDVIDLPTLLRTQRAYVDDDQIKAASPGLHSLEGLPPLMVVYAQRELMADDIEAFVAKTQAAQVRCNVLRHPVLCHDYTALIKCGSAVAEAHTTIALWTSQLLDA
uniref:Secreted protein n=1 Tax=Achlya hypogyna TaxID=1202772 RepID=A0A0A7CNS0_ACHHY|nr:secreted protein [Achlya hypogyna]